MVAVCAIYLRQVALEGETTAHFTHWTGSVWLTWPGIRTGILILKKYIKLYEVKQINSMSYYFLIKN